MEYSFSPPVGSPITNGTYDTDLQQLSVQLRDGTTAYFYPLPLDIYQSFVLAEHTGDHYRYHILPKFPRHDASL